MTLTNVTSNSVAQFSAEITESDAMKAMHMGLQAMYPGQVPDVDFGESGDNVVLKKSPEGDLQAHANGSTSRLIEITNVEPT